MKPKWNPNTSLFLIRKSSKPCTALVVSTGFHIKRFPSPIFSTERRDVVTSLVAEGRRQHGAPVALQPTANDGCSRGGFTRARRPLDQAETPGRKKSNWGFSGRPRGRKSHCCGYMGLYHILSYLNHICIMAMNCRIGPQIWFRKTLFVWSAICQMDDLH